MNKTELRYLVASFENAPSDMKLTVWYRLVRAWLAEIEQKKHEKGHWDYDKDRRHGLLAYRSTEVKKEMEKWR